MISLSDTMDKDLYGDQVDNLRRHLAENLRNNLRGYLGSNLHQRCTEQFRWDISRNLYLNVGK